MCLYNKIFDQEFRNKLKSECENSDNYLYRILFDLEDESLNKQRETLEKCCQILFDYQLDENSDYISRIKNKDFNWTKIYETLNELKVAYILKELGFELNFHLDRNQKAGEFEVILGEERFQVEVKTLSFNRRQEFFGNLDDGEAFVEDLRSEPILEKLDQAKEQLSPNGIVFIFDNSKIGIGSTDIKLAIWPFSKYYSNQKGFYNSIDKDNFYFKKTKNLNISAITFISEWDVSPKWNSGGVFYRNPYAQNPLSKDAFNLLKKYCKLHKKHFGPT
jgi:hypothetical protein